MNAAYNDILSAEGLNALIFNNPYAKLCFTAMLTSQQEEQQQQLDHKKKILYIDIDTTFTAYMKAGLLLKKEHLIKSTTAIKKDIYKTIIIYLPTEGSFKSILTDVIDSMADSSIVIFDSVNSFPNMYYNKIDIESGRGLSNLNHLLSIFLMLLVKHGMYLKVPVLATSMIRYKKSKQWVQLPASKRLLQKKSIVKLYVEMVNENDLSVEIITHPTRTPETIIFQNRAIKL